MTGARLDLSAVEYARLQFALRKAREKVRWKPGKGAAHLKKRQRMKHLHASSSLSDYEHVILDIVKDSNNCLYLYDSKGIHYYAVRGYTDKREWLVIFGNSGIMETAFPPENMDEYLRGRGFLFIGRIDEVLRWSTPVEN